MKLYKDDIEKIRTLDAEAAWQYYEAKEKQWEELQTYNGWVGQEHNRISARATWHLNLLYEPTDDEYVQDYIKENFQKDQIYQISDWLKEYYEEAVYQDALEGGDLREAETTGQYSYRKISGSRLTSAADAFIGDMLDWVNWPLIAEHVVDAIEWEGEKNDDADAEV